MKRNIDLTVNGDFQKPRPQRNISVIPMRGLSIFDNDREARRALDKEVKHSELETNFGTGSIKSINDKKKYISLHRSILFSRPVCDRCGGFLYIISETLCERCDNEMDASFRGMRMRAIMSSTN